MNFSWIRWGAFVVVVATLVPVAAHAASYEISAGEDVEAAIAVLQPGDELVLGGGMYAVTERFSIDLAGTEAAPIVIRAKDGEIPHIHRPDANQNLVDIDNAEWVELRGIEWSGGSAGLRISGARNFTIAGCEIHDTGDVAVRANDGGVTYDNLHIIGNNIHHTNNTGEGMYLGCNDDGCRMINSVIERNWVHDTNQASVEQGDGIEIKEGSYGNVVRDNVIHDTNYPCILTYSTVGNGAPNIIEGNVMWNCGDHAIQSAADTIIRSNIILSASAYGISAQPHQSGAPANLQIVHNTIVIPGSRAINVSGAVGSVTIANNAVYSMAGPAIQIGGDVAQIVVTGNVGMGGFGGGGYTEGALTDFVGAAFSGTVPNDVFVAAGALEGTGDAAHAVALDFNGLPHNDPPDVGAYAFDAAGNPGWVLQAGFKEFPDDAGGNDGTGDGPGDGSEDGPGNDGPGNDGPDDGGPDDGGPDAGTDGADDAPGDGGPDGGADDAGASDGSGGGGAGGSDDGASGCGCRSAPAPRPWALLIGTLAWGLRRRRARG